jgi:hypothetical protein
LGFSIFKEIGFLNWVLAKTRRKKKKIYLMVMTVNTTIKQKYLRVETKIGVDMYLAYLI